MCQYPYMANPYIYMQYPYMTNLHKTPVTISSKMLKVV